ncbi:uncharacterized protein [Montipora capricornis]|uniref:uncharacterized protein n=1 Tax=Montipora capricornis TaxID=246305 RepID=UPI0035F115F0
MASPPKKLKLSDETVVSVAKDASEIEIPWNKVAPDYFIEWLQDFSLAQNVVKEMMMMAVLPSIAALLGHRSFVKPSASEPYAENFSFFSLCISPPSSGKSQAFQFGVKKPLMHVEQHNEKLCYKFTESGLRQHLIQQKGVAAIVKDEMYETLQAVIVEREMGTLCRLYDGDSISVNTGNSASRISTQETCVSLGGFIQVKNFLADLYPAMVESQNGFEQRFLYAIVKPKAMTRKETEAHVHRHQEANLHDLNEIYDAVYQDLKSGVRYTFSADALAIYDDFDNEIVNILNSKWRQGVLVNDDAEIGKDRRQVIRLAVLLYVLYSYSRRAIFQSYGTVPSVIGKRYVQYAIDFMSYFRN